MNDRIEKEVVLKAPIEKVWRALTDHVEFGTWFRVKLDGPFVEGKISTGWMTYPGYEHMKWTAWVIKMEKPTYFAFEWPLDGDANVDYTNEPKTLVEFWLEAIAEGTRLRMSESGFENVPEDRRESHFHSNDGGWTEQMGNIKAHVEK